MVWHDCRFACAPRVAQSLARIPRREWSRRQAFADNLHSLERTDRNSKDERAGSARASRGSALQPDASPCASGGIWRSIRRRKWRLRPEIGGKDRDRQLHGRACAARLQATPVQMAAARAHTLKSERCSRVKQYNRRSGARYHFWVTIEGC